MNIRELGGTVLGTIDDLIGAYGQNAENRTDADTARIEAYRSQQAINQAKAAADIEQKRQITQIFTVIAYVALAMVGLMVLSSVYKKVS